MKSRLLFLFICLPFLLQANGAGVDGYNTPYVGSPRFIHKQNISMLSEKLSMKFTVDTAFVHVTYTFVNRASADNIYYGFPVDYYSTGDLKGYEEDGPDFWAEVPIVKDVEFLYNGKTLHSVLGKEQQAVPNEPNRYRSWYHTEFSIAKGDTVKLEVLYKVRCGSEDYISEKSGNSYGDRHFYYDFEGGQYWGNGVVGSFEVELDFNDVPILAKHISIQGLRFKQEGKNYLFKSANFDFASAKQLEVIYGDIANALARAQKLQTKINERLKATATAELKGYPAKQLADGDMKTAWVAKDNGINQTIEIALPASYNEKEFTLAIYNGYLKSEQTYYNNSRIKSATIAFYDKGSLMTDYELFFHDLEYSAYDNFIDMATCIPSPCWADTIKITILEVYPGAKYNEVCVSEIALHDYFYPIQ